MEIKFNVIAPAKAVRKAGMPKRRTTDLLASLPNRVNLNKLFIKCTVAVNAIAVFNGKKIANTGSRIVFIPNPARKAINEPRSAKNGIKIYSICYVLSIH